MRKTHFASLAASAALASATIVGGAGLAQAQSASSEEDASVVGTETIQFDDRFTLIGTAYDNCTVAFKLTSDRTDGVTENLRADYRVGGEDSVMDRTDQGVREQVYRPAVVSNETVHKAITEERGNPYDVGLGTTTIDLTEDRTVPDKDDTDNTTVLPGVEPNDTGEHTITFGVYQGSGLNENNKELYETTEDVVVSGCPITDDGGLLGGVVGSVDVFGSLENFS